jgi:hypothetical protein
MRDSFLLGEELQVLSLNFALPKKVAVGEVRLAEASSCHFWFMVMVDPND